MLCIQLQIQYNYTWLLITTCVAALEYRTTWKTLGNGTCICIYAVGHPSWYHGQCWADMTAQYKCIQSPAIDPAWDYTWWERLFKVWLTSSHSLHTPFSSRLASLVSYFESAIFTCIQKLFCERTNWKFQTFVRWDVVISYKYFIIGWNILLW